jgi:hypothetical protein
LRIGHSLLADAKLARSLSGSCSSWLITITSRAHDQRESLHVVECPDVMEPDAWTNKEPKLATLEDVELL